MFTKKEEFASIHKCEDIFYDGLYIGDEACDQIFYRCHKGLSDLPAFQNYRRN